ncbi:hypothetical protein M413DRAFT_25208 [Hebeloma cylindrosporum]|uniref:FYVE-type domain-containing protein n=1 Tax=Hebeloma cylindrosporum TaxID=76867 RepID=A0A0C2YUU7_HEBCY|nr:hypothetical protein M413DRAFT_25208 [Hebeloma cylindrosporum h7]
MASVSSTPLSVDFPLSESPQRSSKPGTPLRAPHLPFRRISLPTAPSLLHRISVVSVASFDSFPEDGDESPQSSRTPVKGLGKSRPISVESPRRRKRARDTSIKPDDDRHASRRRKVVDEFYETEKAYVDGLELIYSHFLTPIITSLDTSEPLLNRSALTTIFSNFIDIWNLHRSFLSSLTSLLDPLRSQPPSPTPSTSLSGDSPPELSPLLLSHFPYLSLYTPFVTAFPSTISALNELITPPSTTRPNPHYNQRFATFLIAQEADPRCGKLRLRDWLLTIVQRCPRYLLLLKDLINSTNRENPEHTQLTAVHTLVSKITLSLNTSLHTHAQTMSLLALQRATPNLPFQLVSPGRTLLKRGSLLQVERSGDPVEREFLLFSDRMIWLAPAEPAGQSWDWSWSGSGSSVGISHSSHNTPAAPSKLSAPERVPMTRSRSKSEAELSTLKAESRSGSESALVDGQSSESPSTPVTPQKPKKWKSHFHGGAPPPPPNMAKRTPSVDDKWVYKGGVELVDGQVIVGSALEDERKFEVLSPEGSFVIYAGETSILASQVKPLSYCILDSEQERDDWASEIRNAKAQLLVSLNITNPNSTLTSSASTNHVRRALQALPYPPSDQRLATVKASTSLDFVSASTSAHGKAKSSKKAKGKHPIPTERRRKVEHWVPAIWIPDGKTTSCMRCGRMFGWRRRRHHCRLCGRCVCSTCSGRTFFISDSNAKEGSSSKPARACDACYETVFPLIDPPDANGDGDGSTEADAERGGSDTITSLSHLPSWLSMPALPVQRQPQALMAIDTSASRDLSLDSEHIADIVHAGEEVEHRSRLRVKSHQRLRSYRQILAAFQEEARIKKQQDGGTSHQDSPIEDDKFEGDAGEDREAEDQEAIDFWRTPTHSVGPSPVSSPLKRREDTARRSKRFSLPAIALHTTSVTARTTEIVEDASSLSRESSTGEPPQRALSRRFSLVLAGRNSTYMDYSSGKTSTDDLTEPSLARGVAAARLSELLGRKSRV